MHRVAWVAATLLLMALSFAAGRMTLGARIMPEIVATLPNDESQFSRELDARLRERFPVGTSQDKLIGYLIGANFVPDWSSPEIFVHAVYPTRRFLPARLQVFLEDLKAWKSPLWIPLR